MRFGLIWGSYSPYTPGPFLYLWVSPDNRCLGHTLHRVLPEKGPGCRNQLSNGFLGAERRKSFCCIFSSRGMRERLQPCEEEFWLSLPHRRACSSSCRSRPLLSTWSLGHLIRSSGQRNPEHGLLSGYSKEEIHKKKIKPFISSIPSQEMATNVAFWALISSTRIAFSTWKRFPPLQAALALSNHFPPNSLSLAVSCGVHIPSCLVSGHHGRCTEEDGSRDMLPPLQHAFHVWDGILLPTGGGSRVLQKEAEQGSWLHPGSAT